MTESEAKFEIIEHIPIIGFRKYVEALNIAINALEKQIPKKPTKDYVVPELDFCFICGTEVTGCGYCPNCGQRIDFGE